MDNFNYDEYIKEEIKCDFRVSEKRKKIWYKEMEMFLVFKDICEHNGLTYYLGGGSLLGAARHQGFIPWDDDFDVGMPRTDYEKFKEIALKEIKPPIMVQCFETEKNFTSAHIKLRNVETTGIRYKEWSSVHPFCQGIFFDIFPYDNIPDGTVRRKIHYIRERILRHIINNGPLYVRDNYGGAGRKFIHKLCMLLDNIYPAEKTFMNHEKLCRKYNDKNTELWGPITTFYDCPRLYYKRADFENTVNLPFEFSEASAPENFDSVLTTQYGDWHKFVKGDNYHGDVFFDTEKPWTEYINRYEELKNEQYVL